MRDPGRFVDHFSRLGVAAITGKPHKPTTQGKNERFHPTLFHYLDKQPPGPGTWPTFSPRSTPST